MATTESKSSDTTKQGAVGPIEEIQGVVTEATFNDGRAARDLQRAHDRPRRVRFTQGEGYV